MVMLKLSPQHLFIGRLPILGCDLIFKERSEYENGSSPAPEPVGSEKVRSTFARDCQLCLQRQPEQLLQEAVSRVVKRRKGLFRLVGEKVVPLGW